MNEVAAESPICHVGDLELIKDEWSEVHSDSALKSPLQSFEYINLWYSCFAGPDDVRVYRVTDKQRTIGFLPLVRRKYFLREISSLTNDHCVYSEPLVRKGYESIFSPLLLEELYRDQNGWDILRHHFSYSFFDFPGLFSEDLLKSYGISWQRVIQPTYLILLNKSFEEYFRLDLSYNMGENIKKAKKRLTKTGEATFRHYQGPQATALWPKFLEIEDSGWKGASGSSIIKTASELLRYYDCLVKLMADKNCLHMYFFEIDGKAIAGGFGYEEGDTFHYQRAGYDEQFKALSPSNLLLLMIIEHLIGNFPNLRRLNLFPWDHGYKHRFINTEASCIDTILYSKTLKGKITYKFYRAKASIKRVLRRN